MFVCVLCLNPCMCVCVCIPGGPQSRITLCSGRLSSISLSLSLSFTDHRTAHGHTRGRLSSSSLSLSHSFFLQSSTHTHKRETHTDLGVHTGESLCVQADYPYMLSHSLSLSRCLPPPPLPLSLSTWGSTEENHFVFRPIVLLLSLCTLACKIERGKIERERVVQSTPCV